MVETNDAVPAAPVPSAIARARGGSRARWIVLVLSVVAGPLLAEFALRVLLFGESEWAVRAGRWMKLREPGLFASPLDEDDYWKLERLFQADPAVRFAPPGIYDARLGWRSGRIRADYDNEQRARVAGRRPFLLYGGSFCEMYFDEVFAADELASTWGLVNYTVGGFGPDQAYLLMQASIDRWIDERPVVAFGLDVNGDFDRAALSLRTWPKPRGVVTGDGAISFDPAPIPATREFLEREPPDITSYLWRALERNATPHSFRERREEASRRKKVKLLIALVRATDRELKSRGIDYFYVLFNEPFDAAGERSKLWQENFFTQLFEKEGIRYQLARPVVRAALEKNGEKVEDYFIQPPHPRMNHPSVRGLTVLLECFREGLEGK